MFPLFIYALFLFQHTVSISNVVLNYVDVLMENTTVSATLLGVPFKESAFISLLPGKTIFDATAEMNFVYIHSEIKELSTMLLWRI